jgi:hypothetical protein
MGDSLVGFLDAATETTLAIDDASRTLTLSPTGDLFTVYAEGIKLTLGVKTVTWANAVGLHYFYIDSAGDLQTTQTFSIDMIKRHAFVSVLYWDPSVSSHAYFGNERHGIYMGTSTHAYLHTTRGAQWERGLSLTGFSVDGTGNSNANAQFTSASGKIWDEDIPYDLAAQAQIPVLYRSGTTWKKKAADPFPVIYSGTAGYSGTRIPYNLNSAGTWSLAEVDANKFVLVHVFATNDIDNPVVALQGTTQYASKTAARDGARTELETLTDLPFLEFTPLGSVIFETQNSYTNTPKARIVSIDGANYADKRGELFRPGTL